MRRGDENENFGRCPAALINDTVMEGEVVQTLKWLLRRRGTQAGSLQSLVSCVLCTV